MGCLAIFLIPFVLIGLLLLVNIPYQALAMFNPQPELTLSIRGLWNWWRNLRASHCTKIW